MREGTQCKELNLSDLVRIRPSGPVQVDFGSRCYSAVYWRRLSVKVTVGVAVTLNAIVED
jgi:hypothetical protein